MGEADSIRDIRKGFLEKMAVPLTAGDFKCNPADKGAMDFYGEVPLQRTAWKTLEGFEADMGRKGWE